MPDKQLSLRNHPTTVTPKTEQRSKGHVLLLRKLPEAAARRGLLCVEGAQVAPAPLLLPSWPHRGTAGGSATCAHHPPAWGGKTATEGTEHQMQLHETHTWKSHPRELPSAAGPGDGEGRGNTSKSKIRAASHHEDRGTVSHAADTSCVPLSCLWASPRRGGDCFLMKNLFLRQKEKAGVGR